MLTIVISNYNYARYLSSAIESSLDQTVPCEVIAVDDASTDESWDVIKSYACSTVRGVRLKKNSGGNARGKNVGICMSDTEYITCLDSDDMLLPTSMEDRMKIIDEFDFVHGFAYGIRTSKSYSHLDIEEISKKSYTPTKRVLSKFNQEPHRWTSVINASAVLSRRSLYEQMGLYDEAMRWKIDREMWWRLLSHGAKRGMIYKYVSIYRKHADQVTSGSRKKWKNAKHCTYLMGLRKKSREGTINSSNTTMIQEYAYQDFIEEVT